MCPYFFWGGGGFVSGARDRAITPSTERINKPLSVYHLMIFQNGYMVSTRPCHWFLFGLDVRCEGIQHSTVQQDDGTVVSKIVNDTTRVRLLLTSISRWKTLNNTTAVPSWFFNQLHSFPVRRWKTSTLMSFACRTGSSWKFHNKWTKMKTSVRIIYKSFYSFKRF